MSKKRGATVTSCLTMSTYKSCNSFSQSKLNTIEHKDAISKVALAPLAHPHRSCSTCAAEPRSCSSRIPSAAFPIIALCIFWIRFIHGHAKLLGGLVLDDAMTTAGELAPFTPFFASAVEELVPLALIPFSVDRASAASAGLSRSCCSQPFRDSHAAALSHQWIGLPPAHRSGIASSARCRSPDRGA